MDLSKGSGRCNCSFCGKGRMWGMIVKPVDFKLLEGENELSDYQFNSKSIHHVFCKNCGVRPFEHGNLEALGGEYYTVNVACLDDVDADELAASPVVYADGKNNKWMEKPADIRNL